MIKALLSRLAIAALAAVLVACGGGGGGDTCIFCPADGGGSPATGASLSLIITSPTLATDGAARVNVRATVKDANNGAVPDQEVNFSASSGTLSASTATTDSEGVAEVVFNTDDNKANRTVTITATHGSLTRSTTISVLGTTLSFGGDLAGVIGQPVNMTVVITDAAGTSIQNTQVSLSSSQGNPVPGSVTTNAQGQASFSFTPTVGGSDLITASALGASTSQTLSVSSVNFSFTSPSSGATVPVSTAGGCQEVVVALDGFAASSVTITNPRGSVHTDAACSSGTGSTAAVGLSAGVARAWVAAPSAGDSTLLATATDGSSSASTNLLLKFIAITPATVVVQGSPSTIGISGTSNITALVKDAFGNPVSGQTVTFTAPNGGGVPSPAQAVTDEAGRAATVFNADPSISGKDSVAVVATVGNTGVTGQAELTVSGNAVNIVIGTDNLIQLIDPISFRKVYAAFVTDTAGNPVPNQTVTIALNYLQFEKGIYVRNPDTTATIKWIQQVADLCTGEEPNNNGLTDAGEIGDFDGDGVFEPNGSALVRPPSGGGGSTVTVVTGDSGSAEFWLEYPRSYGSWAEVAIIGTAVVAGKNNVSQVETFLPVPASELIDETVSPSFAVSPFGVQAGCSIPD